MNAERFRQIRNLFDAAMEKEPGARDLFLKEACTDDADLLLEVGRLLAAHGEPTAWIDEDLLGESGPRLEGKRIDSYEILREIGRGGTGAVYLASRESPVGRTPVALKVVRLDVATAEVLRRFRREREILQTLDHPSIARILDSGTTPDGLPYIVMEYVDGQPIDVYCEHHQLSFEARLRLFRQVCDAVQYAHDHRVIHRDLKPGNILVGSDGRVKLLDFGIARLCAADDGAPTRLTRTDLLLMTPEYASPEQVSGGAVSPASDVYSLGVVLFEMLTRRRPYRLKSRILREIVRVVCEDPPTRPSMASEDFEPEFRRRLKGDMDAVLLHALEKDPLKRYASAQDFGRDVDACLNGDSVRARRLHRTRAVYRFFSENGPALAVMAAVGLLVRAEVIRLPEGAWAAAPWIGALLIVAYAVARRLEGKLPARQSIGRLTRLTLLIGALDFFLLTSLPPSTAAWIALTVSVICPLLTVPLWIIFFRWRKRERVLGPLSFDLTPASWRKLSIAWVIAFSLILAAMAIAFRGEEERRGARSAAAFVALAPLLVTEMLFPLVAKFEMRRLGFARFGLIVPWADIHSHAWESREQHRTPHFLLKVRLKRRPMLFPVRDLVLQIPPPRREWVEQMLAQQDIEWPA